MINIAELPDLVVCSIIKQVRYKYNLRKHFARRLTLLAINHQFRRVGLPLVFNCFFVDIKCVGKQNGMKNYNEDGNHDFFFEPEYRPFVKMLKLGKKSDKCSLEAILLFLVIFMKNLSDTPLDLMPREGESTVTMIRQIIEEFVKRFPNLTGVIVGADESKKGGRDFLNKWVNVLGNQLNSFHCKMPFGTGRISLDVPLELTSLTFSCGDSRKTALPKFNPCTLEYLHLIDPYMCFDWECFGPTKDNQLVFPNLTTLEYSCVEDLERNEVDTSSDDATIKTIHLHFPSLKDLAYTRIESLGIAFKPETMSTHLNSLKIKGDDVVLEDFGPLPITSVGTLDIDAKYLYSEPNDELYDATNHLFGEVTAVKESSMRWYNEMIDDDLDFERVRWTNLTRLSIRGFEQHRVIPHLDRMPSLRDLLFEVEYHLDMGEPVDARDIPVGPLVQLNDHGLEQFAIYDPAKNWPSYKHAVAVCVLLAKSVKCLKSIRVNWDGNVKEIVSEFRSSAKQYPRLKNIKVSKIPRSAKGWEVF